MRIFLAIVASAIISAMVTTVVIYAMLSGHFTIPVAQIQPAAPKPAPPTQADVIAQVTEKLRRTGLGGICDPNIFRYSNVQVVGHSIDGNNDVILIKVTAIFFGKFVFNAGKSCGFDQDSLLGLGYGGSEVQKVLEVKAHFRLFDSGWKIEGLTL